MSSASLSQAGGNYQNFNLPRERIHYRCRTNLYPFRVKRTAVPDDKVRWDTSWADYKPPEFTSRLTSGRPWADPDLADASFRPKWNAADGPVDRRSHTGGYEVRGGMPTNPVGRTGLCGRGVLGRWGPNHAADAVVTRWKREGDRVVDPATGRPVLQLVSIRKRNGEWGIPGGMINPGESQSAASRREFVEEVLAYDLSPECGRTLDALFARGVEVYRGYVDNPRNTDNAWVETVAFHYHDGGCSLDRLRLVAGDDACEAAWVDVDRNTRLFSAHHKFLIEMTTRLNAHF